MVSDLTLIFDLSCRCPVKLPPKTPSTPPHHPKTGFGEGVHPFFFFFLSFFLSRHGSYERTAQALHYGTGATDVHAYRPLQRKRAIGGPRGGRQGRTAGLEADGRDNETRGREPGSQQRENGSPVNSEGEDLPGGAKGFTQLQNRQRGSGCRWVTTCHLGGISYWTDAATVGDVA